MINKNSDELKVGDKYEIRKKHDEDGKPIYETIDIDEFLAEHLSCTMVYSMYMFHKRIKYLEDITSESVLDEFDSRIIELEHFLEILGLKINHLHKRLIEGNNEPSK